ncbi:MAG: hypothetical protein NT038_10780 [Euryarchaeota archaeon]|nr:hypothetical protein [Euryarchaeota archaeon]
MKDDPIAKVLDNLMKFDDILACMVGRRGMIDSVLPSDGTDSFKPEIMDVWDVIKRGMDNIFVTIQDISSIGLEEITYKIRGYEVLFYVLPDTENALVAIVPSLANKGLIDVELTRSRQRIQKILENEKKGETEQASAVSGLLHG